MFEEFIKWLSGLNGGAATFVGAFTGSAVGLVAILLGALYNAHLNRKRDDRLRRDEARSIAAAIRAELVAIITSLKINAESLEKHRSDFIGPDLTHMVRVLPELLA